jgi:hypothetical protein
MRSSEPLRQFQKWKSQAETAAATAALLQLPATAAAAMLVISLK